MIKTCVEGLLVSRWVPRLEPQRPGTPVSSAAPGRRHGLSYGEGYEGRAGSLSGRDPPLPSLDQSEERNGLEHEPPTPRLHSTAILLSSTMMTS